MDTTSSPSHGGGKSDDDSYRSSTVSAGRPSDAAPTSPERNSNLSDQGLSMPVDPDLPRVPMQFACSQCKLSKVRCEKMYPCSRCLRLDLDCCPQNRSRGRPLKLHKTRSESGDEQYITESGGGGNNATTDVSSTASVGSTRRRQREEKEAVSSSSGALGVSPNLEPPGKTDRETGAMDRGVYRPIRGPPVDPNSSVFQICAQAYSTTVPRMKTEGTLQESRAVSILKTWATYNYRNNVDITLGVYDAMLHVLGPAALNMPIGPRDPNVDPDHKLHDDDGNYFDARFLPPYLKQLDDGVAACMGYIFHGGEFYLFCNSRYSNTFMTSDEMNYKFRHLGVLPGFLWATALDPEDVFEFYSRLMEYCCSEPALDKEMSAVCKSIDKHGQRFMGLVRVRYVVLMGGTYSSLVMSTLPLPQSRYVCSPETQPVFDPPPNRLSEEEETALPPPALPPGAAPPQRSFPSFWEGASLRSSPTGRREGEISSMEVVGPMGRQQDMDGWDSIEGMISQGGKSGAKSGDPRLPYNQGTSRNGRNESLPVMPSTTLPTHMGAAPPPRIGGGPADMSRPPSQGSTSSTAPGGYPPYGGGPLPASGMGGGMRPTGPMGSAPYHPSPAGPTPQHMASAVDYAYYNDPNRQQATPPPYLTPSGTGPRQRLSPDPRTGAAGTSSQFSALSYVMNPLPGQRSHSTSRVETDEPPYKRHQQTAASSSMNVAGPSSVSAMPYDYHYQGGDYRGPQPGGGAPGGSGGGGMYLGDQGLGGSGGGGYGQPGGGYPRFPPMGGPPGVGGGGGAGYGGGGGVNDYAGEGPGFAEMMMHLREGGGQGPPPPPIPGRAMDEGNWQGFPSYPPRRGGN